MNARRLGVSAPIKALAREGSLTLLGFILNAILGFGFTLLAAHLLRVSMAGALFEAIAAFTIISRAMTLGADAGLLRFTPQYMSSSPRATRSLVVGAVIPPLLVSLLVAVVIYKYAPQIAIIFGKRATVSNTASILRLFAAFLPAASCSNVILAASRAWSPREAVAITLVLVPLLRPILLGLFTIGGVTLALASLAWVCPLALALVCSFAVVRQRLTNGTTGSTVVRDGLPTDGDRGPAFWRFSLPRSLAGAFDVLLLWLDVILVGFLAGSSNAATYTVVSRYVVLGAFPISAVNYAIAPHISRLLHLRKVEDLGQLYRTSTWWIMIMSLPIMFTLASDPRPFLDLFGQHYLAGASALTIIALGMSADSSTGNNATMILMAGGSTANLLIMALAVAINVGLNVVLIPRIGLSGAAIAWAASITAINLLTSTILWRRRRFHPFGREFLYVILCAGACFGLPGLCARLVFAGRPLPSAFLLVGSCLAYLVLMYAARRLLALEVFGEFFQRRR